MQGESAFRGSADGNRSQAAGINQIIGTEPTAEFATELSDESERLLSLLPDEAMRSLALLKMEGYSNKEAAAKLE